MQHHDAITGTHPRNTGLDYERMMEEGRENEIEDGPLGMRVMEIAA